MLLTREKGQRMWGGGGSSIAVGGGGGTSLAGYATESWVDDNYLSKEFWNELFVVNGLEIIETKASGETEWTQVSSTAIVFTPNEIPSQEESTDETTGTTTRTTRRITNIKVKTGLWTEQFLSALGLNAGGGGGGATTLGDLSDVVITNPQNGQALIYNSGTGMWVNGAGGGGGGGGSVTSVGMTVPTGFAISGSPITASGTLALSFATGYSLPLTADVNKGVTAYGWGDHAQAGYALASNVYSKTDADAKFMTIAAFENLFNAIGSDGSTKINHPYTSGVASIKAMVGLWTEQYLSALGQNSGGGGGVTLNEPLASINSAGLGAPSQSGVAIMWNGTAWTYQVPGGGGGGGGTVTSVGMTVPTGFDIGGSPVTGSGTLALSFATGYSLPLTADVNKGVTAYGWGNHAEAGYLKSISSSEVTTALGYTPLSNSTSFWGQTVSSGVVNGSIEAGNSGGAISGFHSIELNSHGTLSGYGGFIDFHYNGSSSDYTSRIIEDASGRLFLDASVGVRIGNALLSWDGTNNALKIQKIDGTAVNFYATGGVSALGIMATDSGMLENLNLTGRLKFIDVENEYEQQIYGDTDGYLHINASEGIELNSDLDLNGYTLYMTGGNIDANYVSGKRFYLGSTRYLYLDANNVLKYYDNGTIRTIAFA